MYKYVQINGNDDLGIPPPSSEIFMAMSSVPSRIITFIGEISNHLYQSRRISNLDLHLSTFCFNFGVWNSIVALNEFFKVSKAYESSVQEHT